MQAIEIEDIITTDKKALSIFVTAGYPELNSTVQTVLDLDKAGVDFIELGIPFSDPMADGPVIQESSTVAIKNGMNLDILFTQVKEIREHSGIPLVLMGYFNPVFKYGLEKFLKQCKLNEITGVIIPDMPFEIYVDRYKPLFQQYNVRPVFMITENTDDERIRLIDAENSSFIYLVSAPGITGNVALKDKGELNILQNIKSLNLKTKIMVGFGISNKATFDAATKNFNGGIVGTAFIKSIQAGLPLNEFIEGIRGN